MKKHKHLVPYYEQSENCECGLCSLAMIFSYYYCEYSINELRELYPVGRDGLNLFIIKNIAEDKGFDTKAFRVNSSYDILFPSIINIDRVHFVVAEKKTRKGIKIVDPQKGRYEISEEEILHKNMTIGLQIVGTEYSEKRKIVVSKKIFDDIKTNMPLIVKSVFVTVLLQTISLLVPICLSKFIDNLSALKVIFNWKILLPIFFVMTLLHITLSIIKEKLLVQLQVRINNEISETFVKKILTLPIHFFNNRGTGDIVHRYTGAVVVREMVSSKIIAIWLDVGMIFLYSIYMMTISAKYLIIMLTLAIIMAVFSILGIKKSRELLTKEVVEEASATAYFNEIVHAINIVKMKGNEDYIFNVWDDLFARQMHSMKNKGNYMATMMSIISSIQFIAPLILFALSVQDALNNDLTIGMVFSIYIVGQGFFAPINSVIGIINETIYALSYYKRIAEVYDIKSEENLDNGIKNHKIHGNIDIKNIYYKYNMHGKLVLNNISLSIKKGEFIGIVGETASGKSTLAMILMGLEKVTEGKIFYDGIEINDINKRVLRKQIGVVSQNSYFFKQSIKENLIFGNNDISMAEIELACKRAAIWDEIRAMPMQLETILSEEALNISGGQRQRLALARAIINRPEVLIVDEGTSALDNITEQVVQKSLKSMECTRVVIAHRLGTIIDADKIVVMKNGEIQGVGNHKELMEHNSYYKKLYKKNILESKNKA